MKKIIKSMLIILLFSESSLSQIIASAQVPPVVKKGFHAKFPTIKRVQWKIKSDSNYEAEFTLKGTDTAMKFDSTGKWLETESAALWSTAPSLVRDTIAKRFKGYKIIEIQTVKRWNKQHTIWEIHLEDTNEIVKTRLDENGAIISQSAKPK